MTVNFFKRSPRRHPVICCKLSPPRHPVICCKLSPHRHPVICCKLSPPRQPVICCKRVVPNYAAETLFSKKHDNIVLIINLNLSGLKGIIGN